MKSRISRGYFLVPVMYILLIGLLINLHFRGGEEHISERVGPFYVEAVSDGGVNKTYSDLHVSFYGFKFEFPDGIPLEGDGETPRSIPVTGLIFSEDIVRIKGKGGAEVVFSTGHSIGAGVFRFPYAYERKPSAFADADSSLNKGIQVSWFSPAQEKSVAAQITVSHEYDIERLTGKMPLFRASPVEQSSGEGTGNTPPSYLCTSTGTPRVDESGTLLFSMTPDLSAHSPEEGSENGGDLAVRHSGCIITPYSGDDPLSYWFFGNKGGDDVAAFSSLLRQWRDSAYKGWINRYLAEEKTWRGNGEGLNEFERIMPAYAAESMRRNSETGMDRFTGAMDAYGGRHSFFPGPYLGNVLGTDADRVEEEAEKASRLRGRMEEGDESLFAEERDLLRFFNWYGDEELIAEFNRFVREMDVSALESPSGLVEFFSCGVKAARLYENRFPGVVEKLDELYRLILKNFVRVNNTPVFPTGAALGEEVSSGSLEMESETALRLATALIAYGRLLESSEDGRVSSNSSDGSKEGAKGETNNGSAVALSDNGSAGFKEAEIAKRLGVTLGIMILSRVDEEGFLPQEFVIGRENVSANLSTLPPERVYPIISDNRFYPRLVSLSEELDGDIRLWTVARAVGAAREGNRISITLDYAVGETEYVVIRGVPSFERLRLYGLRWGSDRRFQTYGVGGWFYNEDLDTLYIKLRHKQKVERLVLEGVD